MVRRDAEPLIWENCTILLEKYVKNSFNQGKLPNPPLELPDFPAQPPKSIDILVSQTLGLFSIDKAGFKSKLSEIFDLIEPDYVKRHIDPESEREKWAGKNIETISKRILILQIRDWLLAGLDESAPDTDRWYFAISTFIGMCFEASDVAKNHCFSFLISISMAQSPSFNRKHKSSGPHHIGWDPSSETVYEDISPHPSGVLATNLILDYLSLSTHSSKLILPFWIENLTTYSMLTAHLNLFLRIKTTLNESTGVQSEALIRATVNLISDFPEQSKEILIYAVHNNEHSIRRSIATSLPKLYSYDSKLTLHLLDILLIDNDETSCVVATSALGFIIRMDINLFLIRAPKVIEKGNQKAMQILINSSIREYINYDIFDRINLLPKLWILCNETSRSKLVSFMLEIARVNPESFLKISKNISNEDHNSFQDLYRWVGMRDIKTQELLQEIKEGK